MFLGPNRPIKYQNVKIWFTFQVMYWSQKWQLRTWVANIKNVASVILYTYVYTL